MKLKIYGSRGSIAFFGRENVQYGGNTVCSVLDIDGHFVVLDCGSGLMQFYYDMKDKFPSGFKFDCLLSHLHLDHIIGFSTFPPIYDPNSQIRIFTRSRGEGSLISQVFGIFRKPYWPVNIAESECAEIIEIKCEDSFMLSGVIKVTSFWSEHHNETVGFRIESGGKVMVYLLDYEIGADMDKYSKLTEFCKNADMVVFDATYLPEDYRPKKGWGHSTFEDGVKLAGAASCGKMIFSHTCQDYTDEILNAAKARFDEKRFFWAYDGMEAEI